MRPNVIVQKAFLSLTGSPHPSRGIVDGNSLRYLHIRLDDRTSSTYVLVCTRTPTTCVKQDLRVKRHTSTNSVLKEKKKKEVAVSYCPTYCEDDEPMNSYRHSKHPMASYKSRQACMHMHVHTTRMLLHVLNHND